MRKTRTLLQGACAACLVAIAGHALGDEARYPAASSKRGGNTSTRETGKDRPHLGFLDPQYDRDEWLRLAKNEKLRSDRPLRGLLYLGQNSAHVAAGTALRNRLRGFIQLRGVPAGSKIVRSYLFWNLSDQKAVGDATMQVLLDGNLVVGQKTADNTEPCWGNTGNHSYQADVSALTDQTGGPNQDYEVSFPFAAGASSTGQNPWDPFEVQDVRLEGASLVVVYRNDTTTGAVTVIAPGGDNMFFSTATYMLAAPALGPALFTMIGADGQRGVGHDNLLSNETTAIDGVQIAGPSVAASDFDGSDGLTLPQLWDTHTHLVTIASNPTRVDYTTPGGDCVVPVAFVIDMQ